MVFILPRRSVRDVRKILKALGDLLSELEYLVDTVIVEGPRDVAALRRLGYGGKIDVCSRVSVSDADLVEFIAEEASSAVILTDFDEEGRKMNRSLKGLMERRGVKVESGLRRQFGRMTAILGVYAIEDLDNVVERM